MTPTIDIEKLAGALIIKRQHDPPPAGVELRVMDATLDQLDPTAEDYLQLCAWLDRDPNDFLTFPRVSLTDLRKVRSRVAAFTADFDPTTVSIFLGSLMSALRHAGMAITWARPDRHLDQRCKIQGATEADIGKIRASLEVPHAAAWGSLLHCLEREDLHLVRYAQEPDPVVTWEDLAEDRCSIELPEQAPDADPPMPGHPLRPDARALPSRYYHRADWSCLSAEEHMDLANTALAAAAGLRRARDYLPDVDVMMRDALDQARQEFAKAADAHKAVAATIRRGY